MPRPEPACKLWRHRGIGLLYRVPKEKQSLPSVHLSPGTTGFCAGCSLPLDFSLPTMNASTPRSGESLTVAALVNPASRLSNPTHDLSLLSPPCRSLLLHPLPPLPT